MRDQATGRVDSFSAVHVVEARAACPTHAILVEPAIMNIAVAEDYMLSARHPLWCDSKENEVREPLERLWHVFSDSWSIRRVQKRA